MSIKPAKSLTQVKTTEVNITAVTPARMKNSRLNLVQNSQGVDSEEMSFEQRNEIEGWARHAQARNGFGDF